MVSSLPMYDFPEIRWALDDLYHQVTTTLKIQGVSPPSQLCHDRPLKELWSNQNLFLSQCCGYDIVARYKNQVSIIGTFEYAAPGCTSINYVSLLVVPENTPYDHISQMQGTRAAINGPESYSGCHSLLKLTASYTKKSTIFFSELIETATHANSLQLIQTGKADVAAIDSITFTLLKNYRPQAIQGIRVIGQTSPAPAPPLITRINSTKSDRKKISNAFNRVLANPNNQLLLSTLLITGFQPDTQSAYQSMQDCVNPNLQTRIYTEN